MFATGTVDVNGTIRITGKAHGAVNTVVRLFKPPEGDVPFYFKQFVDEDQLLTYAREHNLAIVQQGE